MNKVSLQIVKTGLVALAIILAHDLALAQSAPAPSGSWSAASAISPVLVPDPTRGSQLNDVAVNSSGLTIAAWDQYTYDIGGSSTIGAAVQSGGIWAAPFTISPTPGNSFDPKVAVGADGSMAISWIFFTPDGTQQQMQVAVKSPTDNTWTVTTLAQGPTGGVAIAQFVPVAIDAAGNVTAAWTLWNGTRHVVQSATLPKDGTWSLPVTLSGPTTDGLYLGLAVNARGDAAVTYTISPYASGGKTWAEYVFRSGPAGTWTSPVVVSEVVSNTAGYVVNPLLRLDAAGLATVAYFNKGVEATRQLTAATWTTPRSVLHAPNGFSYLSPDLSVDDRGNALLVVSIFDPNIARASVWITRGKANGNWSKQLRLTDPTALVDAYVTRCTLSPNGKLAMVGWIDHYHATVQESTFAGGIWSPAVTIGEDTAFSAFQEVLGLRAASTTVVRAIWKNMTTTTQIMASDYSP